MGRVENSVGKGENAGYQHFLLFPHCFQKTSLSGLLIVGIVLLNENIIVTKTLSFSSLLPDIGSITV